MLYGWAPATLLSFLMQFSVETGRRLPPIRVAYNSSVYALAAAAGGVAAAAAGRLPLDGILTQTPVAAAAFYAVDLTLVALVVSRAGREPFGPLMRRTIRATSIPLVIMICLSVVLVVLWDRSPFLIAALFGPLIAFDLYQRSQLRTLEAMHAAITDPVTGLGNRRRFDERLDDEVPPSTIGSPISLCLLDVDGLKSINDRYGHPLGDLALAAVGARLASSGEAFRLGGDEFAMLLPGVEPEQARRLVELVLIDLVLEPPPTSGSASPAVSRPIPVTGRRPEASSIAPTKRSTTRSGMRPGASPRTPPKDWGCGRSRQTHQPIGPCACKRR